MGVAFTSKTAAKQVQELQEKKIEVEAKIEHLQEVLQKPGTASCNDQKIELTIEETQAVGQFVRLRRDLEETKEKEKASEKLRKELVCVAQKFPSEYPVSLSTPEGEVIFKEASKPRVIKDMNGLIGKLKEKLGYEGLVALIKINLTDVDKYLTPLEAAPFIGESDQPGSRQVASTTVIEP